MTHIAEDQGPSNGHASIHVTQCREFVLFLLAHDVVLPVLVRDLVQGVRKLKTLHSVNGGKMDRRGD